MVRPGRYSYHADMRITDVIGSYKDLLPEPASQYAEIIRLNAPDFHPSVQSFDLADALANPSQAPVLHAMDTVRIFSRFDFENPPSVSVLGDVRVPGTYQTSGQIHIADAVHLAGGLSPMRRRKTSRFSVIGRMEVQDFQRESWASTDRRSNRKYHSAAARSTFDSQRSRCGTNRRREY